MVGWVTNRERHRRFVEQELLPFWGLHVVASWHWLKVTPVGEAVTPLVSPEGAEPKGLLLASQRVLHPYPMSRRSSKPCQGVCAAALAL